MQNLWNQCFDCNLICLCLHNTCTSELTTYMYMVKAVNRFRWPLRIYGIYFEISREREEEITRKVKHSITIRPMIHKSPFFIRFIYCSFWRLFSILYIYLFLYVSVDCDIFHANKISPLKLVLRCFHHFIVDPFYIPMVIHRLYFKNHR